MKKTVLLIGAIVLLSASAWAADGQVLINQSTLNAAGGTYTITQSGSYKLSGNLVVKDANTTPIVVNADNVTIDLNGFTIGGSNTCTFTPPSFRTICTFTSTQSGVFGSGSRLTVTNGIINGMGQYGIRSGGEGTRINSVTLSNNGSDGIYIYGGLISECVVSFNGGVGIHNPGTWNGSVQRTLFLFNGSFGLATANPWGFSQNSFIHNNGDGIQIDPGGVFTVNLGQNLCANVLGTGACPGAVF